MVQRISGYVSVLLNFLMLVKWELQNLDFYL